MSKTHAPPQPGEILLELDDLRPGDLLFGREQGDWNCNPSFGGWLVIDNGGARLKAWSHTDRCHIESLHSALALAGHGRFRVVRGQTTSLPKLSQGWNSTCSKCGSRTYVGFIRVEHENKECRA